MGWTPERLTGWAKKTGPMTVALLEAIMAAKAHPQQGFKACFGILRQTKDYPPARGAGRRAGAALPDAQLGSVASILRHNFDQQQLPGHEPQQALPLHGNIRGGG